MLAMEKGVLMSRLQLKFVACGLTAFYGVVAALGYGLHVFSGCGVHHCGNAVCASTDCLAGPGQSHSEYDGCCHRGHSTPASNARTGSEGQAGSNKHAGRSHSRLAFGSQELGHDPNTCPICALLAQIKVGYAMVNVPATLSQPSVEFTPEYDSAFSEPSIRLGDARGPPRQTA